MWERFPLILMLTAPIFGQVGTSILTGKIVDVTNSAVAAAYVKVVNEASGATLTLRSNEDGLYRATALLPGTYRIEVHATGFDPVARTNVLVEIAQTLAVDFALQVGQQNVAVEVSEGAPALDTQTAS